MTKVDDIPVISMRDVVRTLDKWERRTDIYGDKEESFAFASELTGMSVDKLSEEIAKIREEENA